MTSEQFSVESLRDELRLHPEIWNEITFRTNFEGSPHREVDDIWVRYNSLSNWDGTSRFNDEHTSVWYPVVEKIPSARLLALELKERFFAERLGGVLITRIPPGKQVYPHADPGWHARFYDKFVIQVESSPEQAFCFEEGELVALPGQCYWFNNSVSHWVVNRSSRDRISLIICVRNPVCH